METFDVSPEERLLNKLIWQNNYTLSFLFLFQLQKFQLHFEFRFNLHVYEILDSTTNREPRIPHYFFLKITKHLSYLTDTFHRLSYVTTIQIYNLLAICLPHDRQILVTPNQNHPRTHLQYTHTLPFTCTFYRCYNASLSRQGVRAFHETRDLSHYRSICSILRLQKIEQLQRSRRTRRERDE